MSKNLSIDSSNKENAGFPQQGLSCSSVWMASFLWMAPSTCCRRKMQGALGYCLAQQGRCGWKLLSRALLKSHEGIYHRRKYLLSFCFYLSELLRGFLHVRDRSWKYIPWLLLLIKPPPVSVHGKGMDCQVLHFLAVRLFSRLLFVSVQALCLTGQWCMEWVCNLWLCRHQ